MFECVESNFSFKRCLRQGRVEAPRLWQRMATQLLANVEEDGQETNMGVLLDFDGVRTHQTCSFIWADNFWIMSHSKGYFEQMLRDLIEEVSRWDLEHKPASLWWTSTCEPEERCDFSIDTRSGRDRFPLMDSSRYVDVPQEPLMDGSRCFWVVSTVSVVAAFSRVARLTLQTRILWLVGRCRDRPSRALLLTCPNVKKKLKRRKIKSTKKSTK